MTHRKRGAPALLNLIDSKQSFNTIWKIHSFCLLFGIFFGWRGDYFSLSQNNWLEECLNSAKLGVQQGLQVQAEPEGLWVWRGIGKVINISVGALQFTTCWLDQGNQRLLQIIPWHSPSQLRFRITYLTFSLQQTECANTCGYRDVLISQSLIAPCSQIYYVSVPVLTWHNGSYTIVTCFRVNTWRFFHVSAFFLKFYLHLCRMGLIKTFL